MSLQSSCTEEFSDGEEVQRASGPWEQLGRVRVALSLENDKVSFESQVHGLRQNLPSLSISLFIYKMEVRTQNKALSSSCPELHKYSQ